MSEMLRDRIKAARNKLGLTQAEAGIAWGVPKATLICWENNQRTPRGLALKKLEEVLDEILKH